MGITARTLDQHDHLAGSLRETAARGARFGSIVVPLVADLANGDDRARVVPESEAALHRYDEAKLKAVVDDYAKSFT